jgi:hypothetical protein
MRRLCRSTRRTSAFDYGNDRATAGREDFDVLIQLRAVLPVMRHAVEISETDSRGDLNALVTRPAACHSTLSEHHQKEHQR